MSEALICTASNARIPPANENWSRFCSCPGCMPFRSMRLKAARPFSDSVDPATDTFVVDVTPVSKKSFTLSGCETHGAQARVSVSGS